MAKVARLSLGLLCAAIVAQAPATAPVAGVAALSVFRDEVRVLQPDGAYYRVDKGTALAVLDVDCGLLN